MKKKDKKEYSDLSNALYSARHVMKNSKTLGIFNAVAELLFLGVALYSAYESGIILDILSGNHPAYETVFIIVGILCLYFLYNAIFEIASYLQDYAYVSEFNPAIRRQMLRLRNNIDYELIESPVYKNALRQYLNYSAQSTYDLYTYALVFVVNILKILILGSFLTTLHPLITVGLVVIAIAYYLLRIPLDRLDHKMDIPKMANDRKFNYITGISRSYENAKEVRLYGMSEWINGESNACITEHKRIHSMLQWRTSLVALSHNALNLLRDGFAYIYLIYQYSQAGSTMTAGQFVMYFSAITALSTTLTGFSVQLNRIHRASLNVSELRKLDGIKSTRNHGKGLPVPTDKAEIEFRNVSYRYPQAESDTIKNVSFTIKAGEKLAIVGVNGAGKTTLIKLLCGLYLPSEGEILLGGHPIAEYNIDDYFKMFSAVFQEIALMPYSIAENIAVTTNDNNIDKERLFDAITRSGLLQKVQSLEKGVDTQFCKDVNVGAVDFSGGEKQKLALARAIYLARPVLVLDEPTAVLDPIAENEMYLHFHENAKDKTSVFISHRLASTRFCDRILHLENGTIIESGTHDELMNAGGKYREMFDLQSKYYRDGKEEAADEE